MGRKGGGEMTRWPIATGRTGYEALLGLTVAGLAVASIQSYALVWPAAALPTIAPDFAFPLNQFAWWIIETGFSPVFPVLLAACLGAWLAALDEVPDLRGGRQWGYLGWLLPIGLVHAYLFWFGDLLVPLAIVGLIAAAGARLTVVSQLIFGTGLVLATLAVLLAGSAMTGLVDDSMSRAAALGYPPDRVAALNSLYQAGFWARLPANLGFALMNQLMQIVFLGGGIAGVMLIAMAALRTGFFDLRWPDLRYALSGAVALGIGWPLAGWANLYEISTGFAPSSAFASSSAKLLATPLIAYGYAALVMLACRAGALRVPVEALGRLGRVWLSAYLLGSIVLVFLFSGLPGLSLFAQLSRAALLAIALSLAGAMIAAAWFWVPRFRLGPAEWLWLVLVTRTRQSLRH